MMKKIYLALFVFLSLLLWATVSYAATASITTDAGLEKDKPTNITIHLTAADGSPLGEDKLKIVHTQKLHLLVIDQSLDDYQHLHPTVGNNPGDYVTSFTPRTDHSYIIWADITPVDAPHEYLRLTLDGKNPCSAPCVEKTTNTESMINNLHFSLAFDQPALKAGTAAMGTITVKDGAGKPATNLEPVMGAFAHIVGFSEDLQNVVHIHPMGKEPTDDSQRGGPELKFHMELPKAGFTKLYAQTRVNDQDVFAPFGLAVE